MRGKLLEDINIENYRKLKNFQLKGMRKINLITGANNIGKTSLLEALSFATLTQPDAVVVNLFQILNRRDPEKPLREKKEPLKSFIGSIKKNYHFFSIKSNLTDIEFKNADSIDYLFRVKVGKVNKMYEKIAELDFDELDMGHFVFIVDCGGSVIKLKDWYKSVQTSEEEELINQNIRFFDSNIEKFKIIDDEPSIKIKDRSEYLPISELGDGLKRFIFMLTAFYKVKNGGYVFIDELENGIWYKNYPLIWKNLINLSKKFDVQVFITTHSKELIQAFSKVVEEKDFSDFSLIEMLNDGKHIYFNRDSLQMELDNDFEVRGW